MSRAPLKRLAAVVAALTLAAAICVALMVPGARGTLGTGASAAGMRRLSRTLPMSRRRTIIS